MQETVELIDAASHSRLLIEPEFGCVATSWIVHGTERLALPVARDAFLSSPRTGGLPLLYPFANRLRGDHFECMGRSIELASSRRLKRDGNGLPIHGLLLRWSQWTLSRTGNNHLEAVLRWNDCDELMRAYPFEHTLRIAWLLGEDAGATSLRVDTTIEASGECAVPIAFGWHPYLAVDPATPAVVRLPPREPIPLDALGLPKARSSERRLVGEMTQRVGENQDDLARLPTAAVAGTVAMAPPIARVDTAGHSVEIELSSGYEFMQVYSPRSAPFVCVEPMCAPTAALCDRCACIAPGGSFTASFTMRVRNAVLA